MKRFLLTGVVAAILAGPAAAQKAEPTDVMTMRTAGQPERKLKILKVDRGADGVTLTTVKDIATGETYTLTDRPAGTPAAAVAEVPAPVPTPAPKTAAGRVFAARDGRIAPPVAKDRTTDPLAGTPAVGVAAGRGKSGTYDNNPVANPADPKPGLFTRLFGGKPVPTPGQQVYAPAPKAAAPARLTPPAPRAVMPSAPAPAPAPTIIPSAAQMPVPIAPPAAAAPVAPAMVQSTSGKLEINLPVGVVPAEVRLKEDTADAVKNLQSHPRPSLRMEAATELADGRYGSREEVKQLLAQCAKSDSAGVVRGHCISCLTRLGYADPGYLQELQTWTTSDEPAVRRAATTAIEKLTPRK